MNLHLIKKPIITEKSLSTANQRNVFTFEVDRNANKQQIKEAIEKIFEVEVLKVNTTTRNESVKKTGRRRLNKQLAKVKKAMVQLKEGQTIELFDTYNE